MPLSTTSNISISSVLVLINWLIFPLSCTFPPSLHACQILIVWQTLKNFNCWMLDILVFSKNSVWSFGLLLLRCRVKDQRCAQLWANYSPLLRQDTSVFIPNALWTWTSAVWLMRTGTFSSSVWVLGTVSSNPFWVSFPGPR